jgi:putative ABC transport system ATP-binding protein
MTLFKAEAAGYRKEKRRSGGNHMEAVLTIDSLKKYYGKSANQTKALDGITFQVMPGEFLGIMGSSGSGKSTLLNCIATVSRPDEGDIFLKGVRVQSLKGRRLAEYRGRQIGYLFQNFELLDNLTGQENILLPLSIHNIPEETGRKYLQQLADYLEIRDVLNKFPAQMSGGQKQRVAAARALILEPRIVLADEPTGALDSRNARALMEKLAGLNRDRGTTILMVTHNSNAASYCGRILFIRDGKILHELRREVPEESRQDFYRRILKVTAQLEGGSANVL